VPARPLVACACALALLVAAGCGGGGEAAPGATTEASGPSGAGAAAGADAGAGATVATKNTTRLGHDDPVAASIAVARAVHPGTRPPAVALVDASDWRIALAATPLAGPPFDAALLLAVGEALPDATRAVLDELRPTGGPATGGAPLVRVGQVPLVGGLRSADVAGRGPEDVARAIADLVASARDAPAEEVLVVSGERPEFALPAAAWAARSGDPVLFTGRDALPEATRRALTAARQPAIRVLGPPEVVSARVVRELRRLGSVTRIAGDDPASTAVAFARFREGDFGWGVVDPGHGLVLLSPDAPLLAAAAAPLSSAGTYGPGLVLGPRGTLARPLRAFLLDVQPGYEEDPVRGVYNHGWFVGGPRTVPSAVQAEVDALLEIVPVRR